MKRALLCLPLATAPLAGFAQGKADVQGSNYFWSSTDETAADYAGAPAR